MATLPPVSPFPRACRGQPRLCFVEVYHERQSLLQCARHTINNLLQGPVYSSDDFTQLAWALDRGQFFPDEKPRLEAASRSRTPEGAPGASPASCEPSAPQEKGDDSCCSCGLGSPSTSSAHTETAAGRKADPDKKRFSGSRRSSGSPSSALCVACASQLDTSLANAAATPTAPCRLATQPLSSSSAAGETRTGWFSALLPTSYSAPFGLGNYDLSLLQVLLARHGLELRFRRENAVDTGAVESNGAVESSGDDGCGSLAGQSKTDEKDGLACTGIVTLDQLRDPGLVGFILNVELPKTGWKRLLPKGLSRHFYAIRRVRCTYGSAPSLDEKGETSQAGGRTVEKEKWGTRCVLVFNAPPEPCAKRHATDSSRDAQVTSTAQSGCPRQNSSSEHSGAFREECAMVSRGDVDSGVQLPNTHSGLSEVRPEATVGQCWVNLDSKQETPLVFMDDSALVAYLNRKLRSKHDAKRGEGSGTEALASSEAEDTSSEFPEKSSPGLAVPARASGPQKAVDHDMPQAAAEGNGSETGITAGWTQKQSSEPSSLTRSSHCRSQTEAGTAHLYMPRGTGTQDASNPENYAKDDGYSDAVLIEVLASCGNS
ncbi:hypothetical protein BESB_079340 [Besnoitia besnoiti]|uniref:ubiquitinyl hydrolase 1 n=1 Tax=Besnoitia besnoiti TaxID=94643 RepID=A0A2A9M5G0_BESBE|nr:hypothetical protein BESB_079340 [Besnoitia besnoiti]PFH33718.1 hypothetical protein BESB_079340 [Besnoitia besnoiti]